MTSWVRDGSLMIMCLARPELLDIRSDWGGGRVRATAVELEPLGAADSEVTDRGAGRGRRDLGHYEARAARQDRRQPALPRGGHAATSPSAARRAAKEIPDTVQALIAARIDRLDGVSKAVLQRASVIGRTFWGRRDRAPVRGEGIDDAVEDLLLRDLDRRRVALLAQERDRLPLQARAHPRRRLREPDEIGSGQAPRQLRRVAARAGGRRAARDSRSPPRSRSVPAGRARRSAARGSGARSGSHARRSGTDGAPPQEANKAARHLFLRSVELEPTLDRPLHGGQGGVACPTTCPQSPARWRPCGKRQFASATRTSMASALTALADMVLMREADPIRAREVGRAGAWRSSTTTLRRASMRCRVAWNAAYWSRAPR